MLDTDSRSLSKRFSKHLYLPFSTPNALLTLTVAEDRCLSKLFSVSDKFKLNELGLTKIKTKIKSYKGKVNTNFDIYKIPKQGSLCNCLSVILINSVFRIGKNYYQVFLEKCKFVVKEIKMPDYITKFRPMILVKWMVKKILMKKILMNKIRHRMSQMIHPYIL